ncbi:MAG TPA: hypothetical protein VFV99_18295 [Kofleriaceae bacterium]|nr:hypothetical protein [Kofleriaceae bacterium]
MRGDIAFVGFMMTAEEWQELDPESRAQLIAVATRRADPDVPQSAPRRFPDGTGKHEIVESIDDELESLIELDLLDSSLLEPLDAADAAIEAEIARVDRDGDIALFTDDEIAFDMTAQFDALDEWLALQPQYECVDHDEWVTLPEPVSPVPLPAPACDTTLPEPVVAAVITEPFEDFADWADL